MLSLRSDSSKTIAIVNAHLTGDPEKAEKQIEELNGAKKKLAKYPTTPAVIIGDFNNACSVGSAAHMWVLDVGMEVVDLGVTYAARQVGAEEEPFGGYQVDQIVYSRSLLLLARLETIAKEDIEMSIPNANYPSDHCPVAAVFRL